MGHRSALFLCASVAAAASWCTVGAQTDQTEVWRPDDDESVSADVLAPPTEGHLNENDTAWRYVRIAAAPGFILGGLLVCLLTELCSKGGVGGSAARKKLRNLPLWEPTGYESHHCAPSSQKRATPQEQQSSDGAGASARPGVATAGQPSRTNPTMSLELASLQASESDENDAEFATPALVAKDDEKTRVYT